MRVAELVAGRGYTTELLARAVAPGGTVYGENPKAVLGFAGEFWAARLGKPIMSHVVRVDRELDDPLPPGATGLDAVVMVLNYHDAVWGAPLARE
jgi:predicted methyltransferase